MIRVTYLRWETNGDVMASDLTAAQIASRSAPVGGGQWVEVHEELPCREEAAEFIEAAQEDGHLVVGWEELADA